MCLCKTTQVVYNTFYAVEHPYFIWSSMCDLIHCHFAALSVRAVCGESKSGQSILPCDGRRGIRTPGAINPVVFKTTAIDHSAILPLLIIPHYANNWKGFLYISLLHPAIHPCICTELALQAVSQAGSINALPTYGRSTFGTITEPSAC